MSVRELKERTRSLLAWVLVFSLVAGVTLFSAPELVVHSANTGVVLEVAYIFVDGSEAATPVKIYQQDTETGEDATVTVEFPSKVTAGGELLAWRVDLPNTDMPEFVAPGEKLKIPWSTVISGDGVNSEEEGDQGAISMITTYTLEAWALCTEIEVNAAMYDNSGAYFPENEDELVAAISHLEDGTGFTVIAPEVEPVVPGFKFVEWEMNGYTAGCGEVFRMTEAVEETGAEEELRYEYMMALDLPSIYITAVYTPVVALKYYNSESDYNRSAVQKIVNQNETANAEDPLSVTADISVLEAPAGSTFLSWVLPNNSETPYSLENEISLTWSSLNSGNIYPVVGTWLTSYFDGGEAELADWDETVSVTRGEDAFTIAAPEKEPEAEGYMFTGWDVSVTSIDMPFTVQAGKTISVMTEDGTLVEAGFPYGRDTEAYFTALWRKVASANVDFNLNGGSCEVDGEYLDGTLSEKVIQEAEEDTYYVTMPDWKPEKVGHKFMGWQYSQEREAGEITYTFAPGESTSKENLSFTFNDDGTGPMFFALWKEIATICYADPSGIPLQEATRERPEGEDQFELTIAGEEIATSVPEGAIFLIWQDRYNVLGSDRYYYMPEDTVTVKWADLEKNGNSICIDAAWLQTEYDHGETNVGDWAGKASLKRYENYFTVVAPPAPSAEGKTFTSWVTRVNETDYVVEAGKTVKTLDGMSDLTFDYSEYSYTPIRFTSRWEDTSAATPTPTPTSAPSSGGSGGSGGSGDSGENEPTVKPSPTPTKKPVFIWDDDDDEEDPSPTPTVTPSMTPTPMPTATPAPTATPTPMPTATPVPTATPTPMPTPTPVPTPSPMPTATPVPTTTPTPTEVPEEEPIVVSAGKVKLEAGQKYLLPAGKWVIQGDPTVYRGGTEFYAATSGTFSFSEGE